MEIQDHLKKYEQFTTALYGINLICLIDYEPAIDGGREEPSYPESATVEYVLHAGDDIYELLGDEVVEEITKRFLKWRKEEIENEKAERLFCSRSYS